jgi:hypothetical protein
LRNSRSSLSAASLSFSIFPHLHISPSDQ